MMSKPKADKQKENDFSMRCQNFANNSSAAMNWKLNPRYRTAVRYSITECVKKSSGRGQGQGKCQVVSTLK
jgi:hypothetical protein